MVHWGAGLGAGPDFPAGAGPQLGGWAGGWRPDQKTTCGSAPTPAAAAEASDAACFAGPGRRVSTIACNPAAFSTTSMPKLRPPHTI